MPSASLGDTDRIRCAFIFQIKFRGFFFFFCWPLLMAHRLITWKSPNNLKVLGRNEIRWRKDIVTIKKQTNLDCQCPILITYNSHLAESPTPFVSHCTLPLKPPQSKLKTVIDIYNFTEFSAKNKISIQKMYTITADRFKSKIISYY